MKTNINFLSSLAQFFLESEIFETKRWTNSDYTFLAQWPFFRKSCRLWDNVKKKIVEPGREQTVVWRMRIACWIRKATNKY